MSLHEEGMFAVVCAGIERTEELRWLEGDSVCSSNSALKNVSVI